MSSQRDLRARSDRRFDGRRFVRLARGAANATRFFAALVAAAACLASAPVLAGTSDDLFQSRYSFASVPDLRLGTNTILNLDSLFRSDRLATVVPGITPTSEISANLNLRGVDVRAGFQENQTAFTFELVRLGLSIQIDEGNRDDSLDALERWLQGQDVGPLAPSEIVTNLLQAFVAESPVEPVAGNPGSLQTQLLTTPYDLTMRAAFRPKDEHAPGPDGRVWDGDDVFGIEFDFTPLWADIWNGWSADLDLDYTVNFREPRVALVFDLPLTLRQIEGSTYTVMVQAGAGVVYRALPWWNVSVFGRAGIAGSLQLGSLGVLWGLGTTSTMQWELDDRFKLGDTTFRLGNAFAVSSSIDGIDWWGYQLDYEITNYLLRNGFELDHPIPGRVFGQPLFGRLSFNGNWILGSDVYVDHYYEVGLTFGTQRSLGSGSVRDRATLGLDYIGAPGVNGLRLRIGYDF